MALNSFQFTGGANVSASPVPMAVQITGPTVQITNLSRDVTVFGSLGGSASGSLSPATFVSGQIAGGSGGGSTGSGVGGVAVAPGQSLALAAGANSWLYLATLAGTAGVNVANGT